MQETKIWKIPLLLFLNRTGYLIGVIFPEEEETITDINAKLRKKYIITYKYLIYLRVGNINISLERTVTFH